MKSKSKTKSTETIAPSTFSQPYINDAAGQLRPGFDRSMSLFEKYQPQMDESINYFGGVMNQRGSNPYLDDIARQTRENTMNEVGGGFSAAGRYGSGMFADTAARAISDQENQLRYMDYDRQNNRMDDAAMRRAGLIEANVGMPQQIAGQYAGNVGGLLGRYMTSTGQSTQTGRPSILQLLAQGAQAAATAASDRSLKTNIEKVGEMPDGLGIYDFDYLPAEGEIAAYMAEGRQRGVMADEVARLRPWAMGPMIDGYQTVNYGGL